MKSSIAAVAVLVMLCAGQAWAFPVSVSIVPSQAQSGDAVEITVTADTSNISPSWIYDGINAVAPGQLTLHRLGHRYNILSITGPGDTGDEVIGTIQNQVCMSGTEPGFEYEFCSEVVTADVVASGWAWFGVPILQWTEDAQGAVTLQYPAIPRGISPEWFFEAVVE